MDHPNPAEPGCRSFRLGHDAHWIQARLSLETGEATPGRASVTDDGWITVDNAEGRRRLWCHHPARLARLLEVHGPEVELRPKGVLAVPRRNGPDLVGHALVSVADAASPCVQ